MSVSIALMSDGVYLGSVAARNWLGPYPVTGRSVNECQATSQMSNRCPNVSYDVDDWMWLMTPPCWTFVAAGVPEGLAGVGALCVVTGPVVLVPAVTDPITTMPRASTLNSTMGHRERAISAEPRRPARYTAMAAASTSPISRITVRISGRRSPHTPSPNPEHDDDG